METTTPTVILTEAEAAERILAKQQTMRVWRYRGSGPPYLKLSGKIRYRLSDIEAWIEQSRVVPGESKSKRRKRAA